MEQVRSFIAIELPEHVLLKLQELQTHLKSGGQVQAKWVDPFSIHLTLKFLGSVAADRLDGIAKAMRMAVEGIAPFHLLLKEPGAFPNTNRVQIVWVGIGGEVSKLGQLQQHIESSLAALGFTPESRRFMPHLTLARLREHASLAERQLLGQRILSLEVGHSSSFEVSSISLMKSQLIREGALYSRIASIDLGNNLSTGSA